MSSKLVTDPAQRGEVDLEPAIARIADMMRAMDRHQLKRLGDAVNRITAEKLPAPEGFEAQTIRCAKGPTLDFDGRLLGEYSTQDDRRPKARWTEIRLWETPAGAWVCETVGCSDNRDEVDIIEARAFQPGDGREIAVMDWLGWTSPARALAKRMDWELKVRVP